MLVIKKEFVFRGHASGDHECFCFAVPEEDCVANEIGIDKEYGPNPNRFHPGLYSIYPHDLLGDLIDDQPYLFKITIEMMPIDLSSMPTPSKVAMKHYENTHGRHIKREAEGK